MKIVFTLIMLLSYTLVSASTIKSLSVKTPDGLTINAQEWGNPQGKEIVFIHGLRQSYLSWSKQYKGNLAKDYRILTYDLRGHGDSSKPFEENYYAEGKRFAEELNAVIKAAGFKKPILVGWSLGGVILTNYLNTYGDKEISGLVFVDAMMAWKAEYFLSGNLMTPLASNDLETRGLGTIDFLKACFAKMPTQKEIELMLTFNNLVPVEVQKALGKISTDNTEAVLKAVNIPVLIIHGKKDKLISTEMSQYGKSVMPKAVLKIYPNSGHAPFYEESDKFNKDLNLFLTKI